jgi:hypothetical protein
MVAPNVGDGHQKRNAQPGDNQEKSSHPREPAHSQSVLLSPIEKSLAPTKSAQ